MNPGRNRNPKAGFRQRGGVALIALISLAIFSASPVLAADLLGPSGEDAPLPPPPPLPPPVPVIRAIPPVAVAQPPRCLMVPQPQSDISGQDVIRFRPTWVCFSRGVLADSLPPPPPPLVRPWWRFYW